MDLELTITDLIILRQGWADILADLSTQQECGCPNCDNAPIEDVLNRIAEIQALIRQHSDENDAMAAQPVGRAN